MKAMILAKILELIMKEMEKHAPGLLKKFTDNVLDWIEEHVEGTASQVDDRLVLPLCNMVREAFNIPDED